MGDDIFDFLLERNYNSYISITILMNNPLSYPSQTQVTPSFLSATWAYFALAIGISALGVFVAGYILQFTGMWFLWVLFAVTLVIIFTAGKWSESRRWAIPMFGLFALLMGISTFPVVAYAVGTGQAGLVLKALVASGCMFAASALWGFTTKKDLSGWGGFLLMALIGLIIVGILQIFWFSGTVQLVSSAIGVILFSAFAAYDIQNIKKGRYPNPIYAALSLFLDMILLFKDMLIFMLSLSRN